MKGFFVLGLLALTVSACDAYIDQDAIFIGYNNASIDSIQILVDGVGYELLAPGRSSQFIVKIRVPRPTVGSTGPSSLDRTVQVSVAVRNLRTSQQVGPIFCQAGAKIRTTVWYEMVSGRENVRCQSSY